MNFNESLDLAIQRCEKMHNGDWYSFNNIYPFTTENISGYINYFDFGEKSLLTVGSSADQILNAILMNCKDITLLDINPFVKYYYYLKIAAILELDKDKYLSFFRYKNYPVTFEDNKSVYDKDIFSRIKMTLRMLDYEAYLFWDELFNAYGPLRVRDCMFSMDEPSTARIIGSNNYLFSDENYKLLRNKIIKINPLFINADILDYNCDRKYDNIWLSNIATYFKGYFMIDTTVNKYYSLLKNGGKLLYSYLYQTASRYEKYDKKEPIIYDLEWFFDTYNCFGPIIMSFNGVYSLSHGIKSAKDSVLVLKK